MEISGSVTHIILIFVEMSTVGKTNIHATFIGVSIVPYGAVP